jgi:hypothetical protein
MPGNPALMVNWDSRSGNLAVSLREIMHQIDVFSQELATITDAELEALGYSSEDVSVLRSAVADMEDLSLVFQGQASQHVTGTYDYQTFVKLLYGVV